MMNASVLDGTTLQASTSLVVDRREVITTYYIRDVAIMNIYLSACRTIRPVISSIGMCPRSMSTTRMREVIDMRPPFL
jgi:hypothetical protein